MLHNFERLEVYKDDAVFCEIKCNGNMDIVLSNLRYGNYKARIYYNEGISTDIQTSVTNIQSDLSGTYSDYTYWKVVNANISTDRSSGRFYFNSCNAIPQYVRYCNIHGGDGGLTMSDRRILSQEEIQQGFINIRPGEIQPTYPYIRVSFLTDYGRIISTPANWFE